MNLLYICKKNLHRSYTAEHVIGREFPRVEVQSAGILENVVTEEQMRWADIVFVMEPWHQEELEKMFPNLEKRIVCLDIPDEYPRFNPELVRLLKERTRPYVEGL